MADILNISLGRWLFNKLESPVSLTSNKNSYIGYLANDFNSSIKSPGRFVLPNPRESFSQNAFVNSIATEKKENRSNFAFYSGIIAALLQVVAGFSILAGAMISKRETNAISTKIEEDLANREKELKKGSSGIIAWYKRNKELALKEKDLKYDYTLKDGKDSFIQKLGNWLKKKEGTLKNIGEKLTKNPHKLHEFGRNLNKAGWKIMGASWLIGIPSMIGASLNVKQPSMLLGSFDWLIAAPLMIMKSFENSARLIGFQTIGYSLMYAGIANKVKNDNELKKGEKPREFEFDKVNKNNFLLKSIEFLKFTAKDMATLPQAGVKAVSQTHDYFTGKRKEVPEFWTVKPTENNSKLASLLLLPGSLLLMGFGKKNKIIEKAANILIGTGLLSEALYMFTLGNSQKGINKQIILTGVPLRAIGDFGQTTPAMLGMRTIGGASFEYYFATLNKEKTDKQEKKPQNPSDNTASGAISSL